MFSSGSQAPSLNTDQSTIPNSVELNSAVLPTANRGALTSETKIPDATAPKTNPAMNSNPVSLNNTTNLPNPTGQFGAPLNFMAGFPNWGPHSFGFTPGFATMMSFQMMNFGMNSPAPVSSIYSNSVSLNNAQLILP